MPFFRKILNVAATPDLFIALILIYGYSDLLAELVQAECSAHIKSQSYFQADYYGYVLYNAGSASYQLIDIDEVTRCFPYSRLIEENIVEVHHYERLLLIASSV